MQKRRSIPFATRLSTINSPAVPIDLLCRFERNYLVVLAERSTPKNASLIKA